MPRAANRKERCQQILSWLQEERPCGRPVRLRWVRWKGKESKKEYGETSRDGSTLIISLNLGRCTTWDNSIEILLHEYAHCRTWGMAQIEASSKIDAHDASFWGEFGLLYNMHHYLDGYKHSRGYDCR